MVDPPDLRKHTCPTYPTFCTHLGPIPLTEPSRGLSLYSLLLLLLLLYLKKGKTGRTR